MKREKQPSGFQVIEGGRVRVKTVLNQHVKQSIADRFRFHDAKLSVLAWETGYTQHAICHVIVEIERAEAMEIGRRQAKWMPPTAVAKRAA